jgi:general secretion pathway protein K
MVAAVAGIAVFAMMSLALVQSSEGEIMSVSAEVGQAKAAAAADAGIALALNGLLARDRANRWSIDGRKRRVRFDESQLDIRVEDERGKVPLNLLDEEFATSLVETLGFGIGNAADIARDSLLDWIDEDDEPRPNGAEAQFYRGLRLRPRNGPPQSIDEIAAVRGFTPALVAKMRPFVTVHFGSGSFDARFGQPLAIGIMQGGGIGGPAVINRQRELDGQRPAIELGDDFSLEGRPLMIVVEARRTDGTRAERRMVIELTGSSARPYVVRSYN